MTLKRIKAYDATPVGAVRPNEGFAAMYKRRLIALINAMQADVSKEVKAVYKENPPELAQDESPAMALRNVMKKLSTKWQKRFDDSSLDLAKWFAKGATQRTDAALRAILKKAGFTVEFKMTAAMNDTLQATIGENVGLIKSIASQHLADVEGMVMRSVTAGRDLYTLSKGLKERYGITTRRAALISRDQNSKATANMNRVRMVDAGITYGIWRHSYGGNNPREPHLHFDGSKYDIRKGHDFQDGNGPVMPGQLINCRCFVTPVIPGLD